MRIEKISYQQTNFFSKFILDYLSGAQHLSRFYHRSANIESFKDQILEKQKQPINREALVEALTQQYSSLETSELVTSNIQSLLQENTFTVTTGHQLCLFTGPLYFIYKIITTINLSEQLKSAYPDYNFVPVYWMASEDHDFEEINHVHLFGEKLIWEQPQQGAVGVISPASLKPVLEDLKGVLGDSKEAKELIDLFENAYLNHDDLSGATAYIVNHLFSKYGLVVLDARTKSLKKEAIQLIKQDVLQQENYPRIQEVNKDLGRAQAFVRPINFFYLQMGSRKRIEKQGAHYKVLNSDLTFTKSELELEIETFPERFSPNVLLRPLFKELLLPNLAMIGGGAEVNYWMQLKSTFEANAIVFPILLLRNSALVISKITSKKMEKLGYTPLNFFSSEEELHHAFIQRNKEGDIGVEAEKKQLESIFDSLVNRVQDKGLHTSILAEKKKQLKSLAKMEQKLRKAEKMKHQTSLNQISKVKEKLFPNHTLQERYDNMIPLYLHYGSSFIHLVKNEFDPFDQKFTIFIEE